MDTQTNEQYINLRAIQELGLQMNKKARQKENKQDLDNLGIEWI